MRKKAFGDISVYRIPSLYVTLMNPRSSLLNVNQKLAQFRLYGHTAHGIERLFWVMEQVLQLQPEHSLSPLWQFNGSP